VFPYPGPLRVLPGPTRRESGIESPKLMSRKGYKRGRTAASPTSIETTDGNPTQQLEPEVLRNTRETEIHGDGKQTHQMERKMN
jgi:hypothetical protein